MSWLNSLKNSITSIEKTLEETSKSVTKSLPKTSDELLTALTLTTPELTAQRNALEQSERRKEAVRDSLASLLPWETKKEEHEVLVEDCYSAIMALSTTETTFLEDAPELKESYPELLREFDLDAHVGLINRLLSVDKNLEEIQSKFSFGGEKERKFWKNYFVKCALARETVGLSVEEIWCPTVTVVGAAPGVNTDESTMTTASSSSSVEGAAQGSVGPDVVADVVSAATAGEEVEGFQKVDEAAGGDSTSPGKDFEMVEEQKEDLDDLAAEIARELEE